MNLYTLGKNIAYLFFVIGNIVLVSMNDTEKLVIALAVLVVLWMLCKCRTCNVDGYEGFHGRRRRGGSWSGRHGVGASWWEPRPFRGKWWGGGYYPASGITPLYYYDEVTDGPYDEEELALLRLSQMALLK